MIQKFRAWNKATKEMHEADDIVSLNFEKKQICVKTIFFGQLSYYDFDDIILMQSTGLKDKNDKEIFEGDVVQYQNTKVPSADSKGVIRYFDNWAMFGIDIEHNEPRALFFNGLADHISLDVVGNTYENPELLE